MSGGCRGIAPAETQALGRHVRCSCFDGRLTAAVGPLGDVLPAYGVVHSQGGLCTLPGVYFPKGGSPAMPTVKPRFTITLEEPQYRALDALARVSGQSKSNILQTVLEQATPMMEKMALAVQMAQRSSEASQQDLARRLHRFAAAAERGTAKLGADADLFLGQPEPAGEAHPRSRPQGGSGAARRQGAGSVAGKIPPLSNRGGQKSVPGSKVVKLSRRSHEG
jgi:predicted DNA-binding protein